MRDRIIGAALGAAVGDALGCPFEFQSQAVVRARFAATSGAMSEIRTAAIGELPWIDDLYPAVGIDIHPLGLWQSDPPCGVATDDTRMSWLLLSLCAELERAPAGRELAQRYLEVYANPAAYFPTQPELARQNLAYFVDAAAGLLGTESPAHPGVPVAALRSGVLGLAMPTLLGMIALPCAGCLTIGDAETTYRRAFELAFMDVGFARDVTAVHAVIVSLLCAGQPLPQAIDRALSTDPFGVDLSWRRRIAGWLTASAGLGDRDLCAWLAEQCWGMHPFDPVAALGTALCCARQAGADLRRALLLSVNQWELCRAGTPWRMRDVDCYGSITGSICGAALGAAAIPDAWLTSCRGANRTAYGFDIVSAAERFADVVLRAAQHAA